MSILLHYILCCSCCYLVMSQSPKSIRHMLTYIDKDPDTTMQRIIIHNSTRDVYVGGRNSLFHFNSNLLLKAKVSTGPALDNALCLHPSSPCMEKLTQHDNDNKVLEIIYNSNQDMLLTCGTLYQGVCQVRPLEEIVRSSWVEPFNTSVGFMAGKESTVTFISPGPRSSQMSLYSASTYDGRPLEYTPVSVSSRVLTLKENKFQFEYSHQSETAYTGVDFDPRFKKLYKVDYITGFGHGSYSYFLTTQQVSPESDSIETRLVRICNDDPTFFSYTEVGLKCNYGLDVYNLASAAYLGTASTQLKRRLNIDKQAADSVLYVAFLRTVPEHSRLVDRKKGSVICSFPMSQVLEYFTNATRDCFRAEPRTHLLKHVTGQDLKCSLHETVDSVEFSRSFETFCGSGFNHYIEGRETIPGGVRTQLDAYVTSLAITLQFGKTIAVMGTDNGDVVKVTLERRTGQPLYTVNIANETLEFSNRAIQRPNAFDSSHDNIYFLTGHKVVKFPIGSCSVYKDCISCLSVDDPLACGWCGTYCAHLEECETPGLFTRTTCPPLIYNVFPLSGPTEGGTLITILGNNFGAAHNGKPSSIKIHVAGTECDLFSWEKEKVECLTKDVTSSKAGPVSVEVFDSPWSSESEIDMDGLALSSQNFSYVVPKLYGIHPSYGPVSGGTNITLYGRNLNVGTKHQITINRIPCREFRLFENTSWCVTGKLLNGTNETRRGPVEITMDKAVIEVENSFDGNPDIQVLLRKEFHYFPDPEIHKIHPQVTSLSGTTNLTITGSYLDSVAFPKMLVIVTSSLTGEKLEFERPCSMICDNGTKMICSTPSVNSSNLHAPTDKAPLVTHVAFLMDGVGKLKDLPLHQREMSQLLYYPDPQYYPLSEDGQVKQVSDNETLLEIQGKYLGLSHGPEDIKVYIDGNKQCNVTTVEVDKLYCTLPPMDRSTTGNSSKHRVHVVVGPLQYSLGEFEFVASGDGIFQIIIGVASAIGCGIILSCVLYAAYVKVKRWRRKRRLPGYIVAYTAGNQDNGDANSCSRRRQESNDYQDWRGRPIPTPTDNTLAKGAASCEVDERVHVVDDETMQLLQSENILVKRDYLKMRDIIGVGHFGCVYKGELQLPTENESVEVAVKTLHNNSSVSGLAVEDFLQEGLMMKDFHHINVLSLIGVCFESDGSPMVIMPFMKNGDLHSYITDENKFPYLIDLITFGVQIASGMKYLSEIKFVHRDLAARNCMLDRDNTVKVADFGLSRDIYERDYYSSDNKNKKLPVKWMAPESMEKGTYDTKTDVWSFGVVLWELMTRGVTPYPEVDNWDIISYLKSGRRMLQPCYCPDRLYEIMRWCWLDDSKKRPTFAELEVAVQNVIIELEKKHKEKKVGLNVTYVNCPPPSDPSQRTNIEYLNT